MYTLQITTRWSDVDANGHVRNSAYSEMATQGRVALFGAFGFDVRDFQKFQVGPVLMREELHYFKELFLDEKVEVTCAVRKLSRDFKKFSFIQYILKADGQRAAQVITEGLWLDLKTRRPTLPPKELAETIKRFPKSEEFEWW